MTCVFTVLTFHDRVRVNRIDLTRNFTGRASVTFPQAAQTVSQCRYGATLFSIVVSVSRRGVAFR